MKNSSLSSICVWRDELIHRKTNSEDFKLCWDSEKAIVDQVSRLYIPMWHYLAVWAVLGSVCKFYAFNKVFMKEKKNVFFKATACNCFLKIQSFKRKRKVSPLSVLRFYLYIYQDIFLKKVICQAQGVVLAVNELTMIYTVYQSILQLMIPSTAANWMVECWIVISFSLTASAFCWISL